MQVPIAELNIEELEDWVSLVFSTHQNNRPCCKSLVLFFHIIFLTVLAVNSWHYTIYPIPSHILTPSPCINLSYFQHAFICVVVHICDALFVLYYWYLSDNLLLFYFKLVVVYLNNKWKRSTIILYYCAATSNYQVLFVSDYGGVLLPRHNSR